LTETVRYKNSGRSILNVRSAQFTQSRCIELSIVCDISKHIRATRKITLKHANDGLQNNKLTDTTLKPANRHWQADR